MNDEAWIILFYKNSILDGLEIYGPFPGRVDAVLWGQANFEDDEPHWWVEQLASERPVEDEY